MVADDGEPIGDESTEVPVVKYCIDQGVETGDKNILNWFIKVNRKVIRKTENFPIETSLSTCSIRFHFTFLTNSLAKNENFPQIMIIIQSWRMKYDQKRKAKKSNTKIGKRLLSTTLYNNCFHIRRFFLLMASLVPFICILNTIFQILYCLEKRKDVERRKGHERKSEKLMSRGNFFCGFSFFLCVWLKDVLITIRQGGEGVDGRGGQQSKQFYRLADRFLIALFVVEIFHLDGRIMKRRKENWTMPQKKQILMKMFFS